MALRDNCRSFRCLWALFHHRRGSSFIWRHDSFVKVFFRNNKELPKAFFHLNDHKKLNQLVGLNISIFRVWPKNEQLIEILSKLQYGQVQYPNRRSYSFLAKIKCVTTYHYKWSIVVLISHICQNNHNMIFFFCISFSPSVTLCILGRCLVVGG